MWVRLIILLFVCSTLQAAEIRLSLSEIPIRVRNHHLELKAARWRIEEARGRALGAGRRSNPEIGFEAKHSQNFREAAMGISLEQKFPLTSRLQIEKSISQKLIAMAELEVLDLERKWILEAQSLAIQIYSLDALGKMRKQQKDLNLQLSQVIQSGVERGEISPLDASQTQMELRQLELEQTKLDIERTSLLGNLRVYLGARPEDRVVLVGEWPEVSISQEKSIQRRPDYLLSRRKEDVTLQGVDLAKSKKWEDVNVGVFVEGERMEDAPEGLSNTGFIGIRFSLPLPFWNKNEGEIEEKLAEARRAKAESLAIDESIKSEAKQCRDLMKAHFQAIRDIKEKLLPLAVTQTEELEKAYAQGQAELTMVLRAREQRLKIESSLIDARRDFHLARVRYEAAVGQHVKLPEVQGK